MTSSQFFECPPQIVADRLLRGIDRVVVSAIGGGLAAVSESAGSVFGGFGEVKPDDRVDRSC